MEIPEIIARLMKLFGGTGLLGAEQKEDAREALVPRATVDLQAEGALTFNPDPKAPTFGGLGMGGSGLREGQYQPMTVDTLRLAKQAVHGNGTPGGTWNERGHLDLAEFRKSPDGMVTPLSRDPLKYGPEPPAPPRDRGIIPKFGQPPRQR